MSDFMELVEGWGAYREINRRPAAAAVTAAMSLLENRAGYSPRAHAAKLEEAITTTDFPDLFGFILERDILARYKMHIADWRAYCATGRMPNFNQGELHKVQGNDTRLDRVSEKGEYLIAPVSDYHYHRRVYKRGRQFDISWESIINDSMNAFADIPQRFADAAIRTEAWEVTSTYASAAGPNVLLFGAPITDVDGGLVTNQGVLPLTIANLEITLELMAAQLDILGQPVGVRGVHLVVPTALEYQARAILTSALKQWTEVGAGGGIPVPTANIMAQIGLQMHVDPDLQVIDATATDDTTWYLFADPPQGKAMQLDFLAGHETPEVVMRASDKVTTTGAPLSPFSGDFATDNIFYRVRHVLGGTQLDPRFCYAQVAP